MKGNLIAVAIATGLFVALATPVRLAAQNKQNHNNKHHHYQLIDLGTLGGPASYLACCSPAFRTLNNRGTLAGYADMPSPDPYPGFCFNPDCYVSHAFQWQDGALTDLGITHYVPI